MTPEIPITNVLSAFVPINAVQLAREIISNVPRCRGIAVDERLTQPTSGYAVVQGYFHFRAVEGPELVEAVTEHNTLINEAQLSIRARISITQFVGVAEYWFSSPGHLTGSHLGLPLQDLPKTEMILTARFPGNTHAKVVFVDRPRQTTSIAKAVTIIEVPTETDEKSALGLAYHPERAFETPLCILDLLCLKACWLGRNINFPRSTAKTEASSTSLDQLLHNVFNSIGDELKMGFAGKATPENSLRLARCVGEATVIVASLRMSVTMIAVVKSQLQFLGQQFSGYDLHPAEGWTRPHPYPVHEALQGVRLLEQLARKHRPLFDGILASAAAADKYIAAVTLEETSRLERTIAHKFNLLTLVLTAAAVGISAMAIFDNEIAKALISACYPGAQRRMLVVFLVKLAGCVAAAGVTAVVVHRTYAKMSNRRSADA